MDLKKTISRGTTAKVNVGNYESRDFWSSRTLEFPADTPIEEQRKLSYNLFKECEEEVLDEVKRIKLTSGELNVNVNKLVEKIDNYDRIGSVGTPDDYEELNDEEKKIIQAVKKHRKREAAHRGAAQSELNSQEEHLKSI